jgi:hypothetical protein
MSVSNLISIFVVLLVTYFVRWLPDTIASRMSSNLIVQWLISLIVGTVFVVLIVWVGLCSAVNINVLDALRLLAVRINEVFLSRFVH